MMMNSSRHTIQLLIGEFCLGFGILFRFLAHRYALLLNTCLAGQFQ